MSTLSICTIAQDEAEVIGWFLESCVHTYSVLKDRLKEVVIVDGGSKDNTVEIINSYKDKIPLILIEHPFDTFGDQKNLALDKATGDFIWGADSDMTWTMNFPAIFASGYYDYFPMWDFPMLFTVHDGAHFFHTWPRGVNMRLWKRGPKFSTKFHEKLEGQTQGLPICAYTTIFENSCRQSDEALLHRGRRYQLFAAQMAAEGAGPGAEDRYLTSKLGAPYAQLPDNILSLVLPSTIGEYR